MEREKEAGYISQGGEVVAAEEAPTSWWTPTLHKPAMCELLRSGRDQALLVA